MTGSTLSEVADMDAEELLVTRQMIGQYNREKQSAAKGTNAGKGLPPGVGS